MPGFVGATKGSTAARGYGWTDHIKPRRAAFAALPETSPCLDCGRTMWKRAKEGPDRLGRMRSALHYDHDDQRTHHRGFICADCNRKKGASKGGRVALAKEGTRRTARGTRPRQSLHRSHANHRRQSRCW